MTLPAIIHQSAKICPQYREELLILWEAVSRPDQVVVFIGLNPSTADGTTLDPTMRREIGFAHRWGFRGLVKLNLFSFRATQPADMKRAADPVGPRNDGLLRAWAEAKPGMVVAAWGADGGHLGRDRQVCAMFPHLHALRITKHGHPGHTLYLPGNLTPTPWSMPA